MDTSASPKIVVVTGATSGIGLETAKHLVSQGIDVIGIGRSPERCKQAAQTLSALRPGAFVRFCLADLSLQSQVRAAAAEIRALLAAEGKDALDGLVNNAGAFTYYLTLTIEGFEMQWAVNHLAPFLLTHELLPLLQAAPCARVVTVSSASHYNTRLNWNDIQLRRRYNGLQAYQQTKLCNVLFSAELNRRLGEASTVRAFAADPGLVQTDIGLKGNPGLVRWFWSLRSSGGIPAEESARGVAYLAAEPSIQDSTEVYWKHSQPKAPSKYSLDPENSRRLWELSAQMCGLPGEPGL